MYYALDLLNNLFDWVTKVNVSMHLHFQVQALPINMKNRLEQKVLIIGEDQRTFCSVISTTMFMDDNRINSEDQILYLEI